MGGGLSEPSGSDNSASDSTFSTLTEMSTDTESSDSSEEEPFFFFFGHYSTPHLWCSAGVIPMMSSCIYYHFGLDISNAHLHHMLCQLVLPQLG
jgi:hypothetical protein